jgi:putative membrane protein insertion efficiency factor
VKAAVQRSLSAGAIGGIRAYQQVVSPWLRPACRFQPTCSEYAAEAIAAHGVARGGWLGLRRLCRCHPLGGSGFDPVS